MASTMAVVEYEFDIIKSNPEWADIMAKELDCDIDVDPIVISADDFMVYLYIPSNLEKKAKTILDRLVNEEKIDRFSILGKNNDKSKIYVDATGPSVCHLIQQNNFEILPPLKVTKSKETYNIRTYFRKAKADQYLSLLIGKLEVKNVKTHISNVKETVVGYTTAISSQQIEQKQDYDWDSNVFLRNLVAHGMIKDMQEAKNIILKKYEDKIFESTKTVTAILANH